MLARAEAGNTSFTQRDFRDALSTFATGVTIVTAKGLDGEPVGMTASSFNSVSADPPLILWSVTKAALSAESFRQSASFAVHVLSTDQIDTASLFAKSGADKFSGCEYALDDNGVPLIAGCATRFDCSTWAVYEGGDHWIIVGQVNAIDRAKKEGLVFGGGAFAIAAPLTTPSDNTAPLEDTGSAIESMLFYHLSRAYHQMGHRFHEAVRDKGLTLAEWRILANLHGGAIIDTGELSARTFLDRQSLGDVLSSLETEGLCMLETIKGVPAAKGTPAGTKRVDELFKLSREIEESVLVDASADQREELMSRLKSIVLNSD